MKITKSILKQIIKEELESVIQEGELPGNAVKNPESYCIEPGKSYLVPADGAPPGWATLYIVTGGGDVMAMSTIRLTEKQKAALGQK